MYINQQLSYSIPAILKKAPEMTIEAGSIRYTHPSGSKQIAAPDSEGFEALKLVAQDKFDKITRTWVSTGINMPWRIDSDSGYRCYLDGVITPWFAEADRARGWVDVWALSSAGAAHPDKPFSVLKHRLFGKVNFEKIAVTL